MPKLKKIGIVTLYGNVNYGNRLQNYAVQSILEKRGYKVDTLVGVSDPIKKVVKDAIWIIKILLRDRVALRSLTISRFNHRYIHKRFIVIKDGTFSTRIAEEYDFFVVGSDQVWNPEIRQRERGVFFLDFASNRQKICISPSISVKRIDEKYRDQYRENLSQFPILTCRELDGAKIIEELTGRKCINTIDPTMVLSDKEWRSLSKRISIETPYVMMFFLGDIPSTVNERVKKYAQRNNLIIINPLDKNDRYYCIDPFEFIWLLDNAEIVLTDSFHATAFSINLKTNFYVFDRVSNKTITTHINSRIAALVDSFGVKDRYITDVTRFAIDTNCNFKCVDCYLIEERNKFNKTLNDSLGDKYVEVY